MTYKFIADVMLGKFAKWLRILGFDTLYRSDFTDNEIIFIAASQKRIVLTRDRDLQKSLGEKKSILIKSCIAYEQILQVIEELHLKIDKDRLFSRCNICNSEIKEVSKEAAVEKVPPYIFDKYSTFRYCSNCQKYYWKGTHQEKILKKIEAIIEKKSPE